MPRPTATVLGTATPNARRMTRAKMEEMNPSGIMLNNAFLNRTPAYYVYVYNVSDMQHRIERPWAHPAVTIPPCEEGEAYSRPFIIPDIVAEVTPTVGGRVSLAVNGTDGKFLAQDAIHPEQIGGDWQSYQAPQISMSGSFGTDLYALGCWWSLNESPEPDSDEVMTARGRMEATYQRLIDEATLLSLGSQDDRKKIYASHHRAANYFKLSAPWHQRFTAKVECEGCGQIIPANVARHMPKDVCGFVRNWPAAIRGGMATREEARAAGITLADEPAREAETVPAEKPTRAKRR